MSERRTLVSVDLDPIGCYHAIHGLPAPAAEHADVILARALPRFLELFAELDAKVTFFVVGADAEAALERGRAGSLAAAVGRGHELGNHSFAHPYDLVRRTPAEIADDLARCDAVLRRLGAAPQGFRAPGPVGDGPRVCAPIVLVARPIAATRARGVGRAPSLTHRTV